MRRAREDRMIERIAVDTKIDHQRMREEIVRTIEMVGRRGWWQLASRGR